MDLKLQEHSLRELQEAINAQQEGRQPNFFLEEAELLSAECNILIERIQKEHGIVQTVIVPSVGDHDTADHEVQQHAVGVDQHAAMNSSLAGTSVSRSAVTSPAATVPAIISIAATATAYHGLVKCCGAGLVKKLNSHF